ncbi:MAG: hypothetical protein ORN28_10050 [Rhodoferax sp.]|nr:hypothetical protein [Rhodoferax sp.]
MLRKKRPPPDDSPAPNIQQTATIPGASTEQADTESLTNFHAGLTSSGLTSSDITSATASALASSDLLLPDDGVLLALADAGSATAPSGIPPNLADNASNARASTPPLAFRPSLFRDSMAHQPPPTTWWQDLQAIHPVYLWVPAGAIAVAAVGTTSAGGSAAATNTAVATAPVLNVLPALGPVIHSDNLAFRAYAIVAGAHGGTQLQPLDNVQVSWNTDGTAVVNLKGYKGLVMLSLYSTQLYTTIDPNIFQGDYIDEATGKPALLGGTVLRSIGVADDSNSLHLAVSPITETLVRMLGFAPADNGASALSSSTTIDTVPTGALRTQAGALASLCNKLLGLNDDDAKALSAESLLGFGGELKLAVDSSGYPVPNGDIHGQVLSLISSYQKKNNEDPTKTKLGPSEVISQLALEWKNLTPETVAETASQSAGFAALKALTQFSPAGSINLSIGFDTGYGNLTDVPASDNGTLTDNRTRYQQPQFDMTGLEKTQLQTGDVLQVIDRSKNDAVIGSYRIGSVTSKDEQVLGTGTLNAITPIGQLTPGEHKLYAQVLSSTGIIHRSTTPLTVTVDTTVADVLSATLALDQTDTSDSSNLAQGGRGTNSDKITNIRKPTILVNGLSGKAFKVKDRIEILDTSVTNSTVGYYYVQAGDLDASGNWVSKTALDIPLNQPLADVSEKTTKGIHKLAVRVTDSAGNFSSVSTEANWLSLTIDATAPIPSLQRPGTNGSGIQQDGLLTADRAIELKLSYVGMTAGDVARVLVNNNPLLVNGIEPYRHIISSSDVNANATWTFSLSGSDFAQINPTNGSNTISVVVTDLAGNSNSSSNNNNNNPASQIIWWGPPQLNLPGDSKGFTNGNWINAKSATVNLQLSRFGLDGGDEIVITDGNGHNTSPYTLTTNDFVTGQDWVTIKDLARSQIGTGTDGSFNLTAQVKRNNNVVYSSTPVSVKVDTVAPVVDLNGSAPGNDTTTTIPPATDHTRFSDSTRLFPLYASPVADGGAAVTDTDIAEIRLQFDLATGILKPGDRLRLGKTDLQKDIDLFSAANINGVNVTIEGIPLMDYTYSAIANANTTARTLSVHRHSHAPMTHQEVQNLMLGFQFMNESVSGVNGTRDIAVHFLDAAGNDAFPSLLAPNQSLLHLVL